MTNTQTTTSSASSAVSAQVAQEHFDGWPLIAIHNVGPDGTTCHCQDGARCKSPGKHPKGAWRDTPPIPASRVKRNFGVKTGTESGFFVIDVDPDGMDAMRDLVKANGALPVTRRHQTGRGTYHLFFNQPTDFDVTNRRGSLPLGIDVRGTGGYVVLPPSRSGYGPYSVIDASPIADAPDWLLDMLRPNAAPAPQPVTMVEEPAAAAPTPEREAHLVKYEAMVVNKEIERLANMTKAATNDGEGYKGEPWDTTTFEVACTLMQLARSDWTALTMDEAREIVMEHAPRDSGFDVARISDKVASAIRSTEGKTRSLPAPPPASSNPSWFDEDHIGQSATLDAMAVATGPSIPGLGGPQQRDALNVANPATVVEWARQALGTGGSQGLFKRGGRMVRCAGIGTEGYIAPKEDSATNGPATVTPVDKTSDLASFIQNRYWVFKLDKKGEQAHTLFPDSAAKLIVSMVDDLESVRDLRGVTHTPLVREDGTILAEPGYDSATGFLYLPDPALRVPAIPEKPTAEQVSAALKLVLTPSSEFPFITPGDRANYIGAMLTPLLRLMLRPPFKFVAITAPMPGSGKTLLAEILTALHGGVSRGHLPEADELRKQITSILYATTAPVVHFDNVTGVVRSEVLAALFTGETWQDRPLGSTADIKLPNDRLWVATGNNLSLGGDLPRRTLSVTIDPGMPSPESRTGFAIPDVKGWTQDNRGELIAALLTLVRAWVCAGRPQQSDPQSDHFGTWRSAVRGILANAGLDGMFDDPETSPEAVGADDEDWADFLRRTDEVFGDRAWTVKDLLAKVSPSTFVEDADHALTHPLALHDLPDELLTKRKNAADGPMILSRPLGYMLKKHSGRWAGNICVRSDGMDRTKTALWRIHRIATNTDWTDEVAG